MRWGIEFATVYLLRSFAQIACWHRQLSLVEHQIVSLRRPTPEGDAHMLRVEDLRKLVMLSQLLDLDAVSLEHVMMYTSHRSGPHPPLPTSKTLSQASCDCSHNKVMEVCCMIAEIRHVMGIYPRKREAYKLLAVEYNEQNAYVSYTPYLRLRHLLTISFYCCP